VSPVSADFPDVDRVEHRFVDAGGLRVHLAEAGPADAPPVLLLHGWPQHWYMWRRVIAGLGDDHRVLAPDLRGFGWTEAPGNGYDGDTFASDQIALLDALEIESATVVGHDWGGWATFLLGLSHPGRIERALVCNAPPPWVPSSPRLLLEAWRSWYALGAALPGLGPLLARRFLPRRILSSGHAHDPFDDAELELYLERFRDPARASAVTALYRYYFRAFRDGLRGSWRGQRLVVPTRLLFGARDVYVSPRLVELARPNADDFEVELVPDSGHFIVDEKPELVIERARAGP
jgi:pimeloyl-ACP methyl ester carboxylesterase